MTKEEAEGGGEGEGCKKREKVEEKEVKRRGKGLIPVRSTR